MRSGILAFALLVLTAGSASAIPPGFHRTAALAGRIEPTGVYFAHDGRIFVTEKSGVVFVYANIADPSPAVFADLSANVHDFWDRGLLGFALDPRFPEQPYVYALYALNGGLFDDVPPRWPATGCPNPTDPGAGCVIGGRLSRLTVDGDVAGDELVLIDDWYQQYPSHSVGTLAFGPDGYLYAGGGDGASFTFHDIGQSGNATWPDQRSPPNEGGSLRSLGLEDESAYTGEVWLNGAIIRIDPATGAGAPGNPLAGGMNTPNAQRIVAYGLRNPFRFTFRPGTNGELWLGDVGENVWEEINIVPALAATGAALTNFGWPCFEGRGHHDGFDVPICEAIYQNGGGRTPATQPWYAYSHLGSSDVTGLAFYEGAAYPEAYRHSLFFADNSRTAIFNIPYADENADGVPDPPNDGHATIFFEGLDATAVQLATGPGGDVFFPNIYSGDISRLSYCEGCTNVAPSAAIALFNSSVADGPPRYVALSAQNSVDPDAGDALTYEWDLDGDGVFDDGFIGPNAAMFYADEGSYRPAVRVTDASGASDVQSMIVTVVGNLGPADVGVALDDGTEGVAPGESVWYRLVVTNHGDNGVENEHIVATFSTMLENVVWGCSETTGGASCVSKGAGNVDTGAVLPAGASVTYLVSGVVASDASGTLDARASISAPGYVDPNLDDNLASDSDAIIVDRVFADGFDAG